MVPRRPTSRTPPTSSCSATRAPATSRTRRRRPAQPTMLGEAHVVVVLRDPVERAVSNWRFSTENGLETRPLEDGAAREPGRPAPWDPAVTSVSPFAYLERGRYVDYLEPWVGAFPDTHARGVPARSCSRTTPSLERPLDGARRGPGARAGAARRGRSTDSEGEPPALSAGPCGNTGVVLRGERPRPERPPRPVAALVTETQRGATRDGRERADRPRPTSCRTSRSTCRRSRAASSTTCRRPSAAATPSSGGEFAQRAPRRCSPSTPAPPRC